MTNSKMDIGQVVTYTDKDYEGELNLRVAERYLMLRAAKRCNFNRDKMAKELGFSLRTVYRKLSQHGIEEFFLTFDRGKLVDEDIKRIEKQYPLITMQDEFTRRFR